MHFLNVQLAGLGRCSHQKPSAGAVALSAMGLPNALRADLVSLVEPSYFCGLPAVTGLRWGDSEYADQLNFTN